MGNLGKIHFQKFFAKGGAFTFILLSFSRLALATGDATCSPDPALVKLKETEMDCANNVGVEVNIKHGDGKNGACEAVYKSTAEALDDYIKKQVASCEVANKLKNAMSCLQSGKTNQSACQNEISKLQKEAAAAQKQQKAAADGLIKWIDEKEKQAKKAKEETAKLGGKIKEQAQYDSKLGSKSADVPTKVDPNTKAIRQDQKAVTAESMKDTVSRVTGDLIKEQEKAMSHASEVKTVLQAKAKENTIAQSQLDKMSKTTGKDGDNMKSTPTGKESETGSQAAAKPEEKSAGAGGGMPSMPSPPGGGDKGGNEMTGDTSGTKNDLGDTATPGLIGTNELATGKSKSDPTLNATPGNTGSTEEVGVIKPNTSSGASSISDTSLRDSLKKKLLGQQAEAGSGEALGGMPFGGGGSAAKGKTPDLAPLAMPHFGNGDAGGGGSGDAGDFSMARSETEEAVSHLLNEFTQPGNAGLENGRDLADIEHGGLSSLEGTENTPIFTRVRGTIVRYLKKGRVVNGVNGKI
ncbi:MAG: hypothetical protein AB7K68_16480 [Bacteriovoracia bacterium]